MDIYRIDSSLEETEKNVEEVVEKIEVIENKEQNLKTSLQKLQEDIEISGILSEKLSEQETEKKELNEKINHFKEIVHTLEDDINEMIETNNESQSILKNLESLGEDVQDGLNTIAERKLLIEKCKEQLQQLMEQLNMAGSFSNHSSESSCEGAASDGGENRFRAFRQSMIANQRKKAEDSSDTTDSSTTSNNGDPTTGQKQRSLAHTTDYEEVDHGLFNDITSIWKEKAKMALPDDDTSKDPSKPIRNQILVGKIDPCVDVFGWKRKEEVFSLEEDLKAVNPDYYDSNRQRTTDRRWLQNCQRCVIALEARFRGADVKATARIFDGTDTLPIMSHPNGWLSAFQNATPINCIGKTGLDTGISVLKEMKKNGDGTRAIIRIQYCDTIVLSSPHGKREPFVVENTNGVPKVCDPLTRVPIDITSLCPANDLTEGYEIRTIPNKNYPNLVESILISKKDGKRICTIQKNSGHVFSAIQKNGETIFCDPQTGKVIKNPESYFAFVKSDATYAVRIDNLAFTNRAKDCCESIV